MQKLSDSASLVNTARIDPDKTLSFATFFLDEQEFAIDVSRVREAVVIPDNITSIPSCLNFVEGIFNLRGCILPVLNLKKRFQLDTEAAPIKNSSIAITACRQKMFGLLFDRISEIIRVKQVEIHLLDKEIQSDDVVIDGLIKLNDGERIIQIINPDSLISVLDDEDTSRKLDDMGLIEEDNYRRYLRKTEMMQCITFFINGQELAVDINRIREIIIVPKIHSRIKVEDYIKGIFSFRGEYVAAIDLGKLMGSQEKPVSDESRMIILGGEMNNCGILVDSINDILNIEQQAILPIPSIDDDNLCQGAFTGIIQISETRNVIYTDLEHLFRDDVKKQIRGCISINQTEEDEQHVIAGKTRGRQRDVCSDEVFITFRLGSVFAMEISYIQEIINYTDNIMIPPGRTDYLAGILNLRGLVIPIINLRAYYGLDDYPDNASNKILIVFNKDRRIGLMVDDINKIVKPYAEKYEKIPSIVSDGREEKYRGHIKETIEVENREGKIEPFLVFNCTLLLDSLILPTV